jgi:hypothetical protein
MKVICIAKNSFPYKYGEIYEVDDVDSAGLYRLKGYNNWCYSLFFLPLPENNKPKFDTKEEAIRIISNKYNQCGNPIQLAIAYALLYIGDALVSLKEK